MGDIEMHFENDSAEKKSEQRSKKEDNNLDNCKKKEQEDLRQYMRE